MADRGSEVGGAQHVSCFTSDDKCVTLSCMTKKTLFRGKGDGCAVACHCHASPHVPGAGVEMHDVCDLRPPPRAHVDVKSGSNAQM